MAETRQFVMLLFWLIHFTFFTHAAVYCPSAYNLSEESSTCVKVFIDLGREFYWYQARDECGLDGGDLVKIVNQAMNDFIYDMAVSDSDFYKQSWPWTWIGLNDPYSDNTWVWLDEEDQAAWTNWYYAQPNSNDDDCVAFGADVSGEWWDTDCYGGDGWDMNSYVCEIPALTTTSSLAMTTRTTSTTETTPEITSTATSASSGTTFTTTSLSDVTSDSSMGGLRVGAIAGIVIGALVVAALVPAAFLTIRYFRNRQRTSHSQTNHSVAYTNGLDDREAIVTVG